MINLYIGLGDMEKVLHSLVEFYRELEPLFLFPQDFRK